MAAVDNEQAALPRTIDTPDGANENADDTKDDKNFADMDDTTTEEQGNSQIESDQINTTNKAPNNSVESATANGDSGKDNASTDVTPTTPSNNDKSNTDTIKLRFLFANRDGLNVTVDCKTSDTVGEVKGTLLSVWPKDLPPCNGGESLRLICMGKGILMPDSRTLSDLQVPVFKTHATPVNVSVKPAYVVAAEKAQKSSPNNNVNATQSVDQGCACVIL